MATRKEKVDLIKSQISIQEYFNKVIVPHMAFYYDGEKPDFEIKPTCKCPLHSEDTASFRYYSYSNTYYCFGCASGGDVISLHINFMDVNLATKVSFDEAVNYLYGTFIEGKKNIRVTRRKNSGIDFSEGEPLSTAKEAIIYGRYREGLEKRIFKSDVSMKKKAVLYTRADILDNLVKNNMMNATEALDSLKTFESQVMHAKIVYGTRK